MVISALTAEVITEVNRMTNADKFKSLFGLYATELWAMPEKDFLKWINSEAINCSEIPNNWIPCSERLPEDEYVLISKKPTKISGDKWNVTIAIRTADPRSRKIQWRDIGFGIIQDDKVLAWMPLPEPYRPKEE